MSFGSWIYPLIYCVYSTPVGKATPSCPLRVYSRVDPFCPLLLCLSIHCHCSRLKSAFHVMYLDDVTIGGSRVDILHNLNVVKEAKVLDLTMTNKKLKIICKDVLVKGTILCTISGAK